MTRDDWEQLARALEYPAEGAAALQEEYVRTFDFDPDCALDVGWHLYGDRPERGAFLATLRDQLAAAGVSEGADLPDYLPTVLRLIACGDPPAARALAAAIAPAAAQLLERLRARQAVFVAPLEGVVRALDALRQEVQS